MKRRLICMMLCMCLLTGCSSVRRNETDSKKVEETLSSLETEPDLSYEVPTSIPNILVNQIGYQADGEKTALFLGTDLPAQFQVIDAKSGQVVFTGEMESKGKDETQKKYNAYGDFSELTTPGEYYIKSNRLGMSYSFQVSEELYDDLFKELQTVYKDTWSRKTQVELGTVKSSQIAAALLLSYELYPGAYIEEEDATPNIITILEKEMEWLLSMQNPKTGGVYEVQKQNYEEGEEDLEATAYFAAVLAKFAYSYQKYDLAYANTCLIAAEKAWNYLNNKEYEKVQTIRFFAATELYRTLSRYRYHIAVKEYLTENGDTKIQEGSDFYGRVTYISTSRSVDVNLCSQIMKKLMNQAEEIADDARDSLYMTMDASKQSDINTMLWNMEILSVVDYIITNHEYASVIHNYQHFFLGRNEQSICYVKDETADNHCMDGEAMEDDLLRNAYFMVMMSQIQNKE